MSTDTITTALGRSILTIPGRFVPLFRLAVLDEIRSDARWVKTETAHLADFYKTDGAEPARLDVRLADLGSAARAFAEDYDTLDSIARHSDLEQDLKIDGDRDALTHILHTMVRRAAQDMVDAGTYDPIDTAHVLHLSDAATWAAAESGSECVGTEAA